MSRTASQIVRDFAANVMQDIKEEKASANSQAIVVEMLTNQHHELIWLAARIDAEAAPFIRPLAVTEVNSAATRSSIKSYVFQPIKTMMRYLASGMVYIAMILLALSR